MLCVKKMQGVSGGKRNKGSLVGDLKVCYNTREVALVIGVSLSLGVASNSNEKEVTWIRFA